MSTPTTITTSTPTITIAPRGRKSRTLLREAFALAGVLCALAPSPQAAVGGWLLAAWVAFPPRVWRWQFWLLAAFALGTLAAVWLPWEHAPRWVEVLKSAGIAAPGTLAVQPAVTLGVWSTLATGILGVVWFLGQAYEEEALRRALRIFVLALLPLAAWAAAGLVLHLKSPLQPGAEIFTYFPNRNQSATLYALAALAGGGLWMLEDKRRWKAAGMATLAAALAALAFSPSRGGWLSVGAGALVLFAGSRRGTMLATVALLGFAALVVGGLPGWEGRPAEGPEAGGEIRLEILADATRMLAENPWGVGLGNFEYVYPHYQSFSTGDRLVRHPESDWLWVLTETGALALLLPAAGLTLRWGRHRRGRIVAAVATALLAGSLIDVPGHRLALVFLACALLGPAMEGVEPQRRGSFARVSRMAALLPLGLLFLTAATKGRMAKEQAAFEASLGYRNLAYTRALHERLRQERPLDFEHYQERGAAELAWSARPREAEGFFRKASLLEPALPKVPLDIGFLYAKAGNAPAALGYWREALRRADDKPAVFRQILQSGGMEKRDYKPLCEGNAELEKLRRGK